MKHLISVKDRIYLTDLLPTVGSIEQAIICMDLRKALALTPEERARAALTPNGILVRIGKNFVSEFDFSNDEVRVVYLGGQLASKSGTFPGDSDTLIRLWQACEAHQKPAPEARKASKVKAKTA